MTSTAAERWHLNRQYAEYKRPSSVEWSEPGYAETNRRDTGNTMQTDYTQNEKAQERIQQGFKDRRVQ